MTLPTYPTLLYSGRLWPDTEDPDTTDCSVDPTTATVWCAIPEQARPPAGTQAQVSATDVAASGLFINDLPTFSCDADYCTIAPGAADIQQARTVQSLPTTDLAADACTANPAVIAWTWPSGVAEVPAAALPADLPPDTPGMVVATGNITITDDIAAPANEPLLIVTGCHLVIDGACVYDIEDPGTGVITPADRTSEQRCSQPDPADAVPDTKQPLAISIENVIVVAAGGVWAADLQPVGCAYSAPALTITGSVITGRAGATSLLYNCDDDMPIVNGTEAIVAGYKRTSDLAADIAQWATADVAWWPGRDSGTWRRR